MSPFGRPFLAALTIAISGRDLRETVPVTKTMRGGLEIWDRILAANEGVSFDFILGQLPRCHSDIFVDASTEWGIGGHCGVSFFLFPWTALSDFEADFVVEKELLACLISLFCFSSQAAGCIITQWTDNTSTAR